MDEEFLSDVDLKERDFHSQVREYVIFAMVGLFLYVSSFVVLGFFRRERDDEFILTDNSDMWVYKISLWCCSFSLAVSVGAALLLPISTFSNEILHHYPRSWYIKWLNASLIQGIWNLIFFLTNLSLFLLLPFAYLFCESEGFIGAKRGLIPRAKETVVTLILLSALVLGITFVLSAILDRDQGAITQLYSVYNFYLPFLYSCVSIVGVLLLLVCTPLGFVRLFTLVGEFVTKPQFLRDIEEEHTVARLEEASITRQLENFRNIKLVNMAPIMAAKLPRPAKDGEIEEYLERNLLSAKEKVEFFARARAKSGWSRRLGWPAAMLILTFLTGICLYLVALNMMLLASGWRELPSNTANFDLGQSSLSTLGVVGVAIEVTIIGYLLVTSVVGLYSIPVVQNILPKRRDTSVSHLILNCALFVILSSALPLLVKVLGITNFDLIGNYGKIKWLRSYLIIFFVNFAFGLAAAVCLFDKVTHRAQAEVLRRISLFCKTLKNTLGSSETEGIRKSPRKPGSAGAAVGAAGASLLPVVSSPVRIKAE